MLGKRNGIRVILMISSELKTVILQDIFNSITSKYNVYGIKIASNFVNMEYAEGYWSDTIDFVRQQYKEMFCIK